MKKAFTLIEVLISIVLFSIILLFLYKALDITKTSNHFYEKKIAVLKETNDVKSILYEDIAESKSLIIDFDNNGYAILKLQSSNIYHNPFYKYVTYVISDNKSLIRIESAKVFNKNEVIDSFFNEAFVDILLLNIETFKVSQTRDNKKIFSILFKQKEKKMVYFNTLQF